VRELLDEGRVARGGAECASACGDSGDSGGASARRRRPAERVARSSAEHTTGSRNAAFRAAVS
jgi:hypothetical protein